MAYDKSHKVDMLGLEIQAGQFTGAISGALSGAVIASTLAVDSGTKTATATAGAATLNKSSGKITSESLTTAQNALYTLTLTNSAIAAADVVLVSVANGDNTQGTTVVTKVTPAAGSVVIIIANKHATAESLNGTLVISFVVFKA